jgi:hypothetical protein
MSASTNFDGTSLGNAALVASSTSIAFGVLPAA